jgi:uncharacterized 2Fe-2S/4Fe-4S cluster protein (DUF4445 family)
VLAGLIVCGIGERTDVAAFADLGTNGEVAVGSNSEIVCASTAAGPAFEAGRISRGMRAGCGAIDRVEWRDGSFHCEVIGGGSARGICGSGLVDAAAALLAAGLMLPSGRLAGGVKTILLTGDVSLTQADIRELQLAKGAIAAGALLLRAQLGTAIPKTFHLAGAFGNYVRTASAQSIGLLPQDSAVVAVGNAALRGTRSLLLRPSQREKLLRETLARTRHIELGGDASFQEAFADCMRLEPFTWGQIDV